MAAAQALGRASGSGKQGKKAAAAESGWGGLCAREPGVLAGQGQILFGIRRDGKERDETKGSRMPLRLCSLLSALLSSISAWCGGPWASGDPVRSAAASSDTVFSTGPKWLSQKDLGRKALPSALSLDSGLQASLSLWTGHFLRLSLRVRQNRWRKRNLHGAIGRAKTQRTTEISVRGVPRWACGQSTVCWSGASLSVSFGDHLE